MHACRRTHARMQTYPCTHADVPMHACRRTHARMPTANKLLQTEATKTVKDVSAAAKARQASYYNWQTKDRPSFEPGQTVRVNVDDSEWKKGEIVHKRPFCSYDVKMEDGTTKLRTSIHICFSAEPPVEFRDDHDELAWEQPVACNGAIMPPAGASATDAPSRSAWPSQSLPDLDARS